MARIGIDLDGCVYNFERALANFIHAMTGRPLAEMPPATHWRFYEDWGYTAKQFRTYCDVGVDAGVLFTVGDPIEEAVKAIDTLHRAKHSIHIITSRAFGTRSEQFTMEWLRKHHIKHDSVTFAADKSIVAVDWHIDDKPQNVDEMRTADVAAFLLYTGRYDQLDHPYLLSGWDEFVGRILD